MAGSIAASGNEGTATTDIARAEREMESRRASVAAFCLALLVIAGALCCAVGAEPDRGLSSPGKAIRG